MSPQQPVYTRSEWMDGSDDALGPIGDIRDAVIQLDAGDWKGGAESALSAVQGIGELALGGLGGLISYGVDILLNYVDPLKFWMDQLTGDSAQVNGMAMTWASIGDSLRSTASELDSGSSSAMQNMKGESVSRYLSRQGQVVASINTLADASATVGSAVAKAAELVKKTHDYVCKLISDIIGEAVEGVAFAGLTLGASLVKAAVVVGERAIAEAWNVQNLLTLLKMAFDELKSLFDILTAAAPAFLSAIREVGKECGTPGGGCCGEGSSSSSDKPKRSPLDEPVRECPPEEKEEKHLIDYITDPLLEPLRAAEDFVKPLVKPIGDAVKKVVEDPEGYGLTRPFTPKVHVPPSTVGKKLEEEKNNGWSSASGSGDDWGSGGWSGSSGSF
ncbi:hypothetical protein [Actinomyces sp. ICM39]|uniref:hypothetical protein n=1 Tax=Actinomyces sp. ICM39 TaxID=1105029 RepID=UPI0012DD943D|nr:hypothetical protein [Actinomyces sp. ICM39]